MLGKLPPVERLDAAETPATWRATLERVAAGEARALLRRDGKPLAALLSIDEYRLFVRLDEQRREGLAVLERSWAAFDDVPQDELEREVARALTDVRAEQRNGKGPATRSA